MRYTRNRNPVTRLLVGMPLAALLATVSMPVFAARVGQVRAVDIEEQRIVIDGRTYRIGQNLVPRYGATDRLAVLRELRPGVPVEYEIETGRDGETTVVRLILLTDE